MGKSLFEMIGAAARCTVCGTLLGQCGCWTECDCGWLYRSGGECHNPTHGGVDPDPLEITHSCPMELTDISAETLGKYQYCTMYQDRWYADSDFPLDGTTMPKDGAIPRGHTEPFQRPTVLNRARRILGLLGPK